MNEVAEILIVRQTPHLRRQPLEFPNVLIDTSSLPERRELLEDVTLANSPISFEQFTFELFPRQIGFMCGQRVEEVDRRSIHA